MTATTCAQTCSSRATATVQARHAHNSPLVNNPPFRHRYSNPSQSTQPHATAPCGHIKDVPEEPKKDSNDGNPDQTPDSDPDPDLDPNPDPEPESDHEPEHNKGNLINSLSEAIKSLAKSVHKDLSESKVEIRDPNMFDGSDSKKLRGFLLQCKLGKDSKLTPQEHQCHFDNKLCLVCGQGGHIVTACPKAKPCTVKASLGKANGAPAESTVKASEAKN